MGRIDYTAGRLSRAPTGIRSDAVADRLQTSAALINQCLCRKTVRRTCRHNSICGRQPKTRPAKLMSRQ